MANQLDLNTLFQAVTQNLAENRDGLNQADAYNHNHGDNMVEIFKTITEATQTRQGAQPADQLEYASQLLRQRSQSGSAQRYAQGLESASQKLQGQDLTTENAMQMIQSLLSGGEAPPAPKPSKPTGGGLLGSLLGMLFGSGQQQSQQTQQSQGLDLGSLLSAGMSLLQSGEGSSGAGSLDSLVQSLVSGTMKGQADHRTQSGSLVANTLLKLIASMGAK